MRDLLLLVIHLFVTVAKLHCPGGVRAVAAESLLLKQQLIVSNRPRQRASNLSTLDRFVLGLITLFVSPRRVPKLSRIGKLATLFKFHRALIDRKCRILFSSSDRPRKLGPKGPSSVLIAAIGELKQRNPKFGYMKIALQISHAFSLDIDKNVVRRVLAKHYRPDHSGASGPSWLTLIAQAKDSLWSIGLFRYDSILLRSFWVMVVMDVFTRRIIGFGVERAVIDGISICRMFNRAIAGYKLPTHVSTDHDPLFCFHRWLATLRVLKIEEIKSVPYAPVSHPFIERLIGTIRREYLDRVFFWNVVDLTRNLNAFRDYYNAFRIHRSLDGTTPAQRAGATPPAPISLDHRAWRQHCSGLFQTPWLLDYEFAPDTPCKGQPFRVTIRPFLSFALGNLTRPQMEEFEVAARGSHARTL